MAIFCERDRFEPMEYDHFWLSDTPNVIASTTWGNRNRRMVTWVRFLDRRAQRQFYFFDTHLDHEIQGAREKAAALIRERIQALKTDLPVILGGGFRMLPPAATKRTKSSRLRHSSPIVGFPPQPETQ